MLSMLLAATISAQVPAATMEVIGNWQIRVTAGIIKHRHKEIVIKHSATLNISPTTLLLVKDEKHVSLPVYNSQAAPWTKGAKLQQLATSETTASEMLEPDSLRVKSGPGKAPLYAKAKDYEFDPSWATVGRIAGGIPENTPVWIDYICGWSRIDSIVVGHDGIVSVKQGIAHNATPQPPSTNKNETLLANVWVPGRLSHLTSENLYPIVEPQYIPIHHSNMPGATELLPKTWGKLMQGKPLHVLAWGDSVTAGGEASDVAHRYQNRFVTLLQKHFKTDKVKLTTAGWAGRTTDAFLNEPPGAEFNFDHAVIRPKPDLIIMEFVNDAWMSPEIIEEKYSYLLKRFNEIGAEWVIITPHYVRPDWMNSTSVRVEEDPRAYVHGLRQFAAKHKVALADASLRWGHLVKEGIPYTTLLVNSINHPDDRGHEMFAQSLMDIFR